MGRRRGFSKKRYRGGGGGLTRGLFGIPFFRGNGGKRSRVHVRSRKRVAKTTQKHKPFRKLTCSPVVNGRTIGEFSCYTRPVLEDLCREWNRKHPNAAISVHPSRSAHDLWRELQRNLSTDCNEEKCWAKKLKKHDHPDVKDAFAPDAPKEWKKNKNAWLSSLDIEAVLKQFEKRYPCFTFLGPSAIDFDTKLDDKSCVCNRLCNFQLSDHWDAARGQPKKVWKIGIVFNLDRSDQGGSHWVSLFLNMKRRYLFYFDSVGFSATERAGGKDPLPEGIRKFVDKVMGQAKHLGFPLKFDYSTYQHQKGTTECGIYSLYFISKLLLDEKNLDFFRSSSSIPDEEMEKYRAKFFNLHGASSSSESTPSPAEGSDSLSRYRSQ